MPHEYTRQRQGRDFPTHDNTDNIRKEDDAKKTLHNRLEQYKEQAERNAVLIDGNEPPEKGR